jgi:hypothetical protein
MNINEFYPIFAEQNVVIDSRKIKRKFVFRFLGENYNAAEKAKKPLKMVRCSYCRR